MMCKNLHDMSIRCQDFSDTLADTQCIEWN